MVTSEKIKAKELPVITVHRKQASIIMMTMGKIIINLIQENIPIKLIFLSLFYFWVTLEAPLRGISEEQLENKNIEYYFDKVIKIIRGYIPPLFTQQYLLIDWFGLIGDFCIYCGSARNKGC